MEHENDAAAVRIPPPFFYMGALVGGYLLQQYALPLPLGLPETVRTLAAAAALLCGAGMMLVAVALFRRAGQDPKPWTTTPAVVSKGAYRITRNPMYLGMALIQGGIGLALENGWILLFLPPVLVLIYLTAVRHEEAYLERKFGEAYLEYKKSVRRWI